MSNEKLNVGDYFLLKTCSLCERSSVCVNSLKNKCIGKIHKVIKIKNNMDGRRNHIFNVGDDSCNVLEKSNDEYIKV